MAHFGDLQNEIYARGVAGQQPQLPMTYAALQDAAEQAMTPRAFGYVAGSAGQESTARANAEAFERWRIDPRMLREVAERDLSTEILGDLARGSGSRPLRSARCPSSGRAPRSRSRRQRPSWGSAWWSRR